MEQTIMTQLPQPTALLLGAGGAKGAFQIGAWEALEQAGMLRGIRTVAGCSVGALNAALFAIGDLALAREIWHKIQPGDLIARGTEGAFLSRDGLIRTINQLPLDKIRNAPLRVTVSVHHVKSNQPVFFDLNGQTDADIRTLLLASSAIPHVYAPERYLGEEYVDGSATPEGDQCIQPAYAAGHRDMLMVTMRTQFSLYGGQNVGIRRRGSKDLTQAYPDCRFTLIKPLKPLGSLFAGTLDFAPERIRQRMEQGYADAKAQIEGLREVPQTREEMNALLTQMMEQLFPHAASLMEFLRLYGSKLAPNVQMPTLGGAVWYDNIFAVEGWRVQQQRTPGLQSHYRILTPDNKRAAWVLDPAVLLNALREYAASKQNT